MSPIRAFVAAIGTQQARDRTSFFFMLVLPLAIIVIIGTTFGGQQDLEVVVVADTPGEAAGLVAVLAEADDVTAEHRVDLEAVRADIRRFDIDVAVVIHSDGTLGVLSNPAASSSFAGVAVVERAVDQWMAPSDAPRPDVTSEVVGENRFAGQSNFALTAGQNLVLFTFITALTAAVILVRARRSGVLLRALASPAGTTAVVAGLGAGWLMLALVQAGIIVAAGALAFGVDWGAPAPAIVLVVLFAAVGTGAGLLVGALFTSEDTVGAATPPAALVLAALGGCMVPIEVFPDAIRTVAHLTPHFWALEAWKELMFDDAGFAEIGRELGVLTLFALGVIGAAVPLLRRSLIR